MMITTQKERERERCIEKLIFKLIGCSNKFDPNFFIDET